MCLELAALGGLVRSNASDDPHCNPIAQFKGGEHQVAADKLLTVN